MAVFNLIRLVVFGVVIAFALIILGISANFVAQTSHYRVYTASSVPGFGVATAVLTFAILIPAIVIDMLRKGAVTSLIATELGFVGFLWVIWLACGANATAALFGFSLGDCSLYRDSTSASFCSQYQAFQAFSWLNWLILFFYWIALLVMALVAHSRGNKRAFLVPTAELPSNIPSAGEPKIPPTQNYPGGSITPGTYPPQGQYPQQSYTPSQYPQQGYSPAPPQGQMYQAPYVSSPPPQPTNAIPV
jgi:hypothetical protein